MVKTTVAAIISKQQNAEEYVLLTKRSIPPYKDCWCLPGGHIDPNETAAHAVKREVLEETGLEFEGSFLFYADEIIPEKKIHATVLVFSGTGSGSLTINDEVSDISWFSFSDALQLPLAFRHHELLEAYLERSR